tara:strand:+ start:2532 stop:5393 length:2862 start_codon:yes stop_codon:yes gene_type:complete
MASVTQRIPHYLGGVSKQSDIKKFPGQVRECINAYPEPTFGLIKRPGFEFLHSLDQTTNGTDFSGTDLDNAKWFYINRDDDETYIGCIISGAIHIWNGKVDGSGNYVKCTVNTSENGNAGYDPLDYLDTTRDNYEVLTVQDTTYITNKTKTVAVKAAPATNNLSKKGTIRIKGVDYSSKYSVTIKESGGSNQTYTLTTRDVDSYTSASDPGSEKLSTDIILTALETGINALTLDSSFTVTRLKATIELSSNVAFTLECQGGASNELLTCFQDQVEDLAKLPEECSDGRVVKIINTKSDQDTYYAKFFAETGTTGAGYWEETIAQDVSTGLDDKTMPHELQNTAVNVFNFQPIAYTDRLVGDDTTNEHPSFKDNTIQQVFFHNNRLGFLTSDNVSMSQSGQFKNFYHESARALTTADPVDLNCSAVRPAVLHGVLPTTQGLILFSEKSQYIMYADNGVLTPRTTVIRGISNYEIDNKIAPVDNGSTLTFLSKTPGYSRVFSMETQGQENNPNILDIAKTVAEYIPDTITSMVASPQNELIALHGETLSDVFFYRTYYDGKELVLQAWFKWTFPGNVLHLTVDNDTMWAVVKYVDASSSNNRYHLIKTSLTQTPENPILTTNDGASINPYMDMYATASSVTYDTAGDFSKCYLPYGDIANATPVLILKGDASAGEVAGFTLSPDSAKDAVWQASTAYAVGDVVSNDGDKVYTCDTAGTSAGSGGPTGTGADITDGSARWDYTRTGSAYFKVANKDWTVTGENVASKVVVGYKYNYDVTLPKTYYQIAENTYDYTSILTIARMKFSVGLSSVVGFKVKRRGRNTPNQEWDGDGSETNFTFNFDYTDVNDLKVKVNGVETTAYTIADKILTMTGTVPADGYKVLLYTDTWYDIQTVKDANEYLADDVPLAEQSLFTLPIHDKTDNFSVRVFSDSPFPISLTSMMWEGNYSPRYYRRT